MIHLDLRFITLTALGANALGGLAAAPVEAADTLNVSGAYLTLDRLAASNQDFVRLVFRTAKPLPRRLDGSIQAGASKFTIVITTRNGRSATRSLTLHSERGGDAAAKALKC